VIALLSEKRQEIHLLLTRVIRNSSTADAAVTVLVVVAAVVAAVVVVIVVVVVVAAAAAAAAPPRRGWTAAEIQLLWLDLGRDGQVGDAQLAHLPILRRRDGDRAAPSAYRREYDPRHLDPRPWRRRRRLAAWSCWRSPSSAVLSPGSPASARWPRKTRTAPPGTAI